MRASSQSIAYYDDTVGDLIYSRFDGVNWKHATLDSKNVVGQFPSLAFDPANGQPVVAYYRKTSADLRVMRSDGVTWTRTEPDTVGGRAAWAKAERAAREVGDLVAVWDSAEPIIKAACARVRRR